MLSGARVLVTGAAGFVGANLVRALIAEGARVLGVVRPTTHAWRLHDIHSEITIVPCDIRDLPVREDLQEIDVLVHLASAAVDQRHSDAAAMIESNVFGTYAVLRAAERLGVKRFVHVGSSAEYGPATLAREDQAPRPNAEYGATKAAATHLVGAFCQRVGISAVTLRPFSVFGPFEAPWRLIPYCILRALAHQPLEITDGRQQRDYVYVGDVVRAMLAAATETEVNGIVNVCTGRATSVRDVVNHVLASCDTRSMAAFGVRPHLSTEMWTTSGSPDRARQVLGWRAETALERGLAATIDWIGAARSTYPNIYTC